MTRNGWIGSHALAGVCAVVTCALTSGIARAQTPAITPTPALGVHIEAPHAGVVHGPVVQLSARVSDASMRHATLVVNGASYDVPIEQGRVEQQIVAVPGQNRVALMVSREGRVARDSLTFRYDGPPVELVVLLTWPSEGEIVDLWVREPEGETCKWDHRETASGGHLLDFSADAIGFGSQAYVLPVARAGAFRVKLHYWGAWADDDEREGSDYESLLGELDQLEGQLEARPHGPEAPRQRRDAAALRRRLDRWARPAAPQTAVHAEVILLPGTPYERRWRFDRVVHRTGELVTLGAIEIDEAMLVDARSAR